MGKYKNMNNFDPESSALIIHAKAATLYYRAPEIYPEAFLLALFAIVPNRVAEVISTDPVVISTIVEKCVTLLTSRFSGSEFNGDVMDLGRSEEVDAMFDAAREHSDGIIGIGHIFLALLDMIPQVEAILSESNISVSEIVSKIESLKTSRDATRKKSVFEKNSQRNSTKTSFLEKYCKNFNTLAKEGKIESVISRDEEINYAITVLCRKNKSNPVLLGEPGVGKTAIVEGIAKKIVDGHVPSKIKDCEIYSLSLSSLVAGTKYRGDFEERLQGIVSEVEKNPNAIIFIDEMHNLMGAGSSSSGAMDAANILKPALARDLRCIGATTHAEYKKNIESDGALSRRFEKIIIEEPSNDQVMEILKSVRIGLEKFHGCKIPDETLLSCINFLNKYVTSERFPDKAIDCLDTACALHVWSNDKNKTISTYDVARVVSEKSGVPTESIMGENKDKIKNIEEHLRKNIFGQDNAISEVIKVLKKSFSGIKSPHRPIGSLIFGGPSGVGKTFLPKQLAISAFSNRNALVKVDMSEYAEPHSISRIIGSPPGYVGFNSTDTVAERIRKLSYGVLLLDEIEKAHPDVMKIFLQAMSDGYFTDCFGNNVSCRHLIIIMTGNFGLNVIKKPSIGFSDSKDSKFMEIKNSIISYCSDKYGEEFVNRVDAVIAFSDLDNTSLKNIISNNLVEISERVSLSGIDIKFSESLIEHLASITASGYGKNAMLVNRSISMSVEPIVADALLEIKSGSKCSILIDFIDGEIKSLTSQKDDSKNKKSTSKSTKKKSSSKINLA